MYSGKKSWTEEQEDELRQLYMENQNNPSTDMGKLIAMLLNIAFMAWYRNTHYMKFINISSGEIMQFLRKSNNESAHDPIVKCNCRISQNVA